MKWLKARIKRAWLTYKICAWQNDIDVMTIIENDHIETRQRRNHQIGRTYEQLRQLYQ